MNEQKLKFLLAGAEVVADFLCRLTGVDHVGLFGSAARSINQLEDGLGAGNEPDNVNDVDLVVFSDVLFGRLSSGMTHGHYALNLEKGEDLKQLPISDTQRMMLAIIVSHFMKGKVTFDLTIYPSTITQQMLVEDQHSNSNPCFIQNLWHDIVFWDVASESFKTNNELKCKLFPKISLRSGTVLHVVSGLESGGEGSVLIVHDSQRRIMLDCGANPGNNMFVSEGHARKIVELYGSCHPDAIVISHYHFDHCGVLPDIFRACTESGRDWPTIVCTDTTVKLLDNMMRARRVVGYYDTAFGSSRSNHHTEQNGITLYPNRHSVPGSASTVIRTADGKTILYTGDFFGVDYPAGINPDLMIVDCTGGENSAPRDTNEEDEIRKNIACLMDESLADGHRVFIALFSTQMERAHWLFDRIRDQGKFPMVGGPSLFYNMRTLIPGFWASSNDFQVALVTGVWAQGSNYRDIQSLLTPSTLVRLADGSDINHQINQGDMVILSGRVPTWLPGVMSSMEQMVEKLHGLGARVVVDHNAPDSWNLWAEKHHVHSGGHGNLPEIQAAIKLANPKKVLLFHASRVARDIVAGWCRTQDIEVIEAQNGSVIEL